MTPRRLLGLGLFTLALAISGFASEAEGQPAKTEPSKTEPMRVGMVGTLFNDVPQFMVDMLATPFGSLMKEFTGLEGKLALGGEVYEVARKLKDKELDIAVFYGVEFGWAQQKYPDLRPLMLAVNKHRLVRASLVTKADGDVKGFIDLKGQTVSLPRRSKLHCKLFLERGSNDCGPQGTGLFKEVIASPNVEVALDDVLRGKVQAVVTDTIGLEYYESVKPGCFARLKIVQQSEFFPAAVVAYREGALDDGTLKKFRDGMIGANKSERGRALMVNWQMTGFEAVDETFAPALADLLKVYPAPAEAKSAQK